MSAKPKPDESHVTLRSRAEKLVKKTTKVFADNDARRMLHELDVYQIELELQNAELLAAREESEALLSKYTELYDFALVSCLTLTSNSSIKLMNLTASKLVGTERSKLIGQSFAMLIAQRHRASFKVFLKHVFSTETVEYAEFELATTNQLPLIISIKARRCPCGLHCQVVMMDITDRIKAREQMRISEIRYRRLFEAAHDGVLLLDPGSNQIVDANPFMTRLLGYSRDQLIGKELFEIGLIKDEAASREMFRKLKKNHEVRYENLPLKSDSGRHQQVEVVANLYQEDDHSVIQCNIRDITLRKQAEELSSHNLKLKKEIVRREKIEEALRAQRKEQSVLLKQSRLQQRQLRELSHRVLHAQEEERKQISRELHDVITQTLVGINVHLAILERGSIEAPAATRRQITKTQLLVKKAVKIVHDFARKLRPTMLDDLGLIPALHTYLEQFMADTGIRSSLRASAELELTTFMRTTLYRIALGALTNVARHSKASIVEVTIESNKDLILMTIKDNGKGFHVTENSQSRKKTRLGLIGMIERAEMIGGRFQVISAPDQCTIIKVEIPAR
jgi:PAS domain S-box-containing protein